MLRRRPRASSRTSSTVTSAAIQRDDHRADRALQVPTACDSRRQCCVRSRGLHDLADGHDPHARTRARRRRASTICRRCALATELVLNVPRVGFFTTLAFLAEWATNQSNLARVTLNQTMIVALGEPIDTTNTTAPLSLAALDTTHAAPGTTCYACHQSLDPMRQFFRQAVHPQLQPADAIPTETSLPGQFAFHGVSATGHEHLRSRRRSSPPTRCSPRPGCRSCAPTRTPRPATRPIRSSCGSSASSSSSNYSWNTLVQALFSSPLVTYLQDTPTADVEGETFPIARQEHLCATLSNRLGITDVCGLDANTVVPNDARRRCRPSPPVWPSDEYSRGKPTPVLANTPSLFLRTGMENLCVALAPVPHRQRRRRGQFTSTRPNRRDSGFRHDLMGLHERSQRPAAGRSCRGTSPPRRQTGATASDALKSTFVLACLSPYVIGVGQ